MRIFYAMLTLLLLTGCLAPRKEAHTLRDVTQLTTGFLRAGEAYLSKDGQWMVFQAIPPGESQYQMYVSKVKYQDDHMSGLLPPVRISPTASRNTCGFFSPDGRTIIFASTAGRENPNESSGGYQRTGATYKWSFSPGLDVFRADNWLPAIAASQPGMGVNLARHRITDNQSYDAECTWSSAGNWIVFTSDRPDDLASKDQAPDLELYAMKPDGSNVVRLTHTKGYDGGAVFSPDGKRLLYRSDRAGNDQLQLFVSDVIYDPAGNIKGLDNEKALTRDDNVNWGPYWHPSGKYLMYASSAKGHANYELYLMRSDGGANCRITFTDGFDGLPIFSDDGKSIVWSSKRTADGTTQLFAARFRVPLYVR